MEGSLVPIRCEIADMAGHLFDVIDTALADTTELQRQLLAAFAFGMTYAHARTQNLGPAEVHALAVAMLMDVFHYADHQAVAFAEQLIAASSNRAFHSTIHAVIHRGIDGHQQWLTGDIDALRDNIEDMFAIVGGKG